MADPPSAAADAAAISDGTASKCSGFCAAGTLDHFRAGLRAAGDWPSSRKVVQERIVWHNEQSRLKPIAT